MNELTVQEMGSVEGGSFWSGFCLLGWITLGIVVGGTLGNVGGAAIGAAVGNEVADEWCPD